MTEPTSKDPWLRVEALKAAFEITPRAGATGYTRHRYLLYRAQRIYDWLSDPTARYDEYPDLSSTQVEDALSRLDKLTFQVSIMERRTDLLEKR